jgi:hypothetical protein
MERDLMADTTADNLAGLRVNPPVTFVRWVRRTHGWFGLWGALLGLMMGVSGVWLNHRATLKLELPAQQQANGQIALPDPAPATAPEMAAWLQGALKADRPANTMRVERARPVPWAERSAERGSEQRGGDRAGGRAAADAARALDLQFRRPQPGHSGRVLGRQQVGQRPHHTNGFIATLTNLHKGVGMPIPWILLIDTLAGSLIFLSLSGLILWWETNRRRRLGIAIFGAAVTATVGLAVWPLQS